MITTVKQAQSKLKSAIRDKQAYKDSIQEVVEFFINEYNGKLSENKTLLKQVFEAVGKDAVDLKAFLKKYTNMKTLANNLMDFTTDTFDIGKKGQHKYKLHFVENYNGQKWYETSDKTDKKALKDISDSELYIKIRNLIALIKSDKNKSKTDGKAFLRVAEEYEAKLKATAESSKK